MKRYKFISLFSGCGGSSTGYKLAGFKPLLAVDWSKVTKNTMVTYEMNHKRTKMIDVDIRKLSAEMCLELAGIKKGELDLLDGSPPCKGFSQCNTNSRGVENEQNAMVDEMIRLVRGIKPKVFILENVDGFIKHPMKANASRVLREFRKCGYVTCARVLNARDFGVPQSRRRFFIIGIRNDLKIKPTFPTAKRAPIPCAGFLKWNGKLLTEERKNEVRRSKFFKGRFVDTREPFPTITSLYGFGGESPWIKLGDEFYLLSVEEAKLISSFPKNYKFASDDWEECIAQIGNCVPPLLVKALATHIRNLVFDKVPSDSGISSLGQVA